MPVPVTQVRTSHAISIRAGGKTIGHIQTWAPSQARDVKPKYEINAVGLGAPIEHVAGISSSQTVQVARYDLFTKKMEEIWGTDKALYMLTDQHNPFDVEEKWVRYGKKDDSPFTPWLQSVSDSMLNTLGNTKVGGALGIGTENDLDGIDTGAVPQGMEVSVEKLWYSGCWFTSLGRNMQAQGDRIVSVNATMVYTKVRPLL